MVDSPVPTFVYTTMYLSIVCIGPRLMRDRRPFRLNWLLLPYNFAMAALNLYIAIEVPYNLFLINAK